MDLILIEDLIMQILTQIYHIIPFYLTLFIIHLNLFVLNAQAMKISNILEIHNNNLVLVATVTTITASTTSTTATITTMVRRSLIYSPRTRKVPPLTITVPVVHQCPQRRLFSPRRQLAAMICRQR